MGSGGRLFIDLNELPAEEDDSVLLSQPQKALSTSNSHTPDLFVSTIVPQRKVNNNAFSHASSVSGFQPFVKPKGINGSEACLQLKMTVDQSSKVESLVKSGKGDIMKDGQPPDLHFPKAETVEREEGEWFDAEGCPDSHESNSANGRSLVDNEKVSDEVMDPCASSVSVENGPCSVKISESNRDDITSPTSLGHTRDLQDQKSHSVQNLEGMVKGDATVDSQDKSRLVMKQREVKGVEASHALKCANSLGKRLKVSEQKEAMLGKKRSRQTMFLKFDVAVQAVSSKSSSTPRRQNSGLLVTSRNLKDNRAAPPPSEHNGEKQSQPMIKDKQIDCDDGRPHVEISESKGDCNGDLKSGLLARPRRSSSATDPCTEVQPPPIPRQSSWKQPTDLRLLKTSQNSTRKTLLVGQSSVDHKLGNKKLPPPKKQTSIVPQYQDTSVERLIREVTNEKFWHHPEEAELQRVPGQFDSVEEYVGVFEPLLFEECRAQLYSTWEELTEMVSRDAYVKVFVKSIERRERGWHDAILLPDKDCRWTFKEGDVAVLSSPKPGLVRSRKGSAMSMDDDNESEIFGRVAGTVRRHIPIDTRDSLGAILHFYVGGSYDPSSKVDGDHILRKLRPNGQWYLTVLGSLATTQREYIGLHAFRRLNIHMQSAILQPAPEHFPKYEEQPPAMPECFTPNFVDYLHKTFNMPQLSAIQWAAMHTAAGTSSGAAKRQDPWPFTLVQGPPGTGKTHTVCGMLNVIHLVQYQHYYASLLKKLAPESYKQTTDSTSDNVARGSIDEVLQNMDQNLFRTLPKLCPKPRMLVCAPSNAATDELLARVLDRGFIDGEMRVYRPDVARVGVDSQTRAAQAVSVERRTDYLLSRTREEIFQSMRDARYHEAQLSQQIAAFQRELNVAAAAGRSQGSVGVDPEVLLARDQNRDVLLQRLAAVVEARDKALVDMSRFHIVEGRFRAGSSFNLEDARASLEASFANEAEIVFTTVSSSGRRLFSRLSHGFDMVVIDEAAQASEVAVLPPLSLGAARCVLVGDPQQLPATVISKAAGTLLYSRSLFERFQQAGCPTMLLSVQYRMHPQIRDFPSRYFYQGRLTDSESVASLPDEIYYNDPLLKSYLFYDITHGRESHRGRSISYQNIDEAKFCLRLYEHLQKTIKSSGVGKVSIGIITPYKLQLKCLQREFEGVLNSEGGRDIYINTVDAFQGQERDVIIMSCVRASNRGVGFVADIRRMNVALTRGRRALWVMGNANALMQSEDWAALIADAKARGCYMGMDSLPKDFLMSKVPVFNSVQDRDSSMRGLRSSGSRFRPSDIFVEARSGTPSEDDERSAALLHSRNGMYRP